MADLPKLRPLTALLCLLGTMSGLPVQAESADVRVNYLTSLHNSGPSGWPAASSPLAPPIEANNKQLYGLASGGIFTLPTTPSHYSLFGAIHEDTELRDFPGAMVESSLTGHHYGSAYSGKATSDYQSDVLNGAVFRVEFDGTGFELLDSTIGTVKHPNGAVLLDEEDNLYGLDRGPDNNGRLFKVSHSGEFSVIHQFSAGPAGQMQFPNGMTLASNGWLYGITAYRRGIPYVDGTPTDQDTPVGTLYRIDPKDPDTFEILHTFTLKEGEIPWYDLAYNGLGVARLPSNGATLAHLAEGPDGYFYGTTSIGSCLSQGRFVSGTLTLREAPLCGGAYRATFSKNGESAMTSPYPHYDGPMVHGAIYRIAPDGSEFTILHRFNGEDGSQPRGYLAIAQDGFLYGTTLSGGQHQSDVDRYLQGENYPGGLYDLTYDGTLYRLRIPEIDVTVDGKVINSGFEHLHSFRAGVAEDSDGKAPNGVLMGSSGKLYGTTRYGGRGFTSANGKIWQNDQSGTVFEVDLQGDIPGASIRITATPGVAKAGETVQITWTTNAASNCIASGGTPSDGWSGNQNTMGSIEVSPDPGVYYYTLTCDDDIKGGQVGEVVPLRVDADDVTNDGNNVNYGNGGGSLSPYSLLILLLTGVAAGRIRRRSSASSGDILA
ncbi:choice-of-anchor tandem repeat GloVer-containing protein [Hahella ganghwensis]|uniref:choice-of-anchor tandem repeat GloVer-containing protein n=1 Tax=Hahella ganghwensis TaxID=286420 RepID=UPI000365A176|nr:choice-of-anchor tandem repeat GloVer-containing protein [Hahella ganghwensis]